MTDVSPQFAAAGRLPSLVRKLHDSLGGVARHLEPSRAGRWLQAALVGRVEFSELNVGFRRDQALELRLAFLSDLHVGHAMGPADLEQLFGRISDLRPDLICLGGDLIDTRAEQLDLLVEFLPLLSAPLGVFAVPGNHDHMALPSLDPFVDRLGQEGVEVLVNRGCRINTGLGSLWLAGVDDYTESQPELEAAMDGRREEEVSVLLSHHPDVFPLARAWDVDLQLSGHTHGGQVRLLGWAPVHHSSHGYVDGLFGERDARLYVGRGAGTTLLPIRWGAPREVPFLNLLCRGATKENSALEAPQAALPGETRRAVA